MNKTIIQQTVNLPEAKLLYQISKSLNLPMFDPKILALTEEQITVMIASHIEANPELKNQIENTVYDSEYDKVAETHAQEDTQWEDV